jgi:ABC-type multidrug transport system fused ATPase/permease subunit
MMGLQEEPAIKDKPVAYPLVFKGGSIEFDNVHFGYSSTSLLGHLFLSFCTKS